MPFHHAVSFEAPEVQLRASRIYARDVCPNGVAQWQGPRYRHDRIRLAYLSSDFRAHATGYVMAELFERHDRTRFETVAISFGPDDGSEIRARLQAAFEHFVDVGQKSDREIADLMRNIEVDIAVDLKGFTENARPGIFALRPAPVAASYMGFVATMGVNFMDYIIADRTLIPDDQKRHYSEQVVYLPDSYWVNDSKKEISDRTPTRVEAGLPERGFVFCCFNNNYKITPKFFDLWMRLLRQVEGSVLWLFESNPAVARNLRREAQARGIAPERLVFAPRLPLADHLARHRLADLFLDTLPCNAHTTATDALWVGLPVLTCIGTTYAGRVCASLLNAIGLPEMITDTLAAYEALALKLAREETALATVKAQACPQPRDPAAVRYRPVSPSFRGGLHHHGRTTSARRTARKFRGRAPGLIRQKARSDLMTRTTPRHYDRGARARRLGRRGSGPTTAYACGAGPGENMPTLVG